MMAFLLDIITFLQISFSTNIFRINYKWVSDGYDEYKKRLSKSIPLELIELPIAKRTKTGNLSFGWSKKLKQFLVSSMILII
nr:hypothetical protein [Francisella tularensis]